MADTDAKVVDGKDAAAAGSQDPPKKVTDNGADEGKVPEDTSVEEVVFDVKKVEIEDDGSVRWTVDPTDPNSTVYVGKDLDELMENVGKGIVEKDSTIRRQKAEQKTSSVDSKADRHGEEESGEEESEPLGIPPPDRVAILKETFERAGVDIRVANWTDEDWIKWGDENQKRDFQIAKNQERVENLKREAQALYDGQTVEWVNARTLSSESSAVSELLTEFKVDVDQFDWEGVLERVTSDPKNYTRYGKLLEGRVTKAAAVEIQRISKAKTKTELQRKLDEDVATGKRAAEGVRSTTGVREKHERTAQVPKTSEEALQMSLKEYYASHKT